MPIAFVADLSVTTAAGGVFTGLVGSGPGAPVSTPEPSTWAMMLLGFAGLGFLGYRKAKRAALSAA
jgi:hypothetical protein